MKDATHHPMSGLLARLPRLASLALALLVVCTSLARAAETRPYFWIRVWPDKLVQYDIQQDKVVAEVKLQKGTSYSTQLTHDKDQILVVTGQRAWIEVVDLARKEVVDQHTLEEPGKIIRIDDIKEIPARTHWYIKINRVKRELDHFVIEEPEWLYYDIENKKIEERMKELPEAIRRSARISPGGDEWHVFNRDLTILDGETLEEKGKIELSKPQYTGMGALSVRGDDFLHGKDPKRYRMMYTMRDPVKTNRSLQGILELDLENYEIASYTEWGASLGFWRLYMDKARRYGFSTGRGDRRSQSDGFDPIMTLVKVDLSNGKKLDEARVEVRNGLRLSGIAPDGSKLYLAGRGHELVIHSCDDFQHIKTVELDGETDGGLMLVEQ